MIIGVDFDNTIVSYDAIFHRVAVERGLIPADVPRTKTAVRDHLRAQGKDAVFTELQGDVYGPRLVGAEMFPGVREFFSTCRERGVLVKIISHKTRHPYAGEPHDLHAAARGWLEHNEFFAADGVALPREEVFLEPTKAAKLERIAAEGCTHFIDDLPEFLAEPAFPAKAQRILFDPMNAFPDSGVPTRVQSWAEVTGHVFSSAPREIERDPVAVAALLGRIGRRLAGAVKRLSGGGNNRVFEVRSDTGERLLLKQYFHSPGDSRNRFEAEESFYRLAANAAPDQVPRSLAWDPAERLGLFEFVEGRKLTAAEIGREAVNTAMQFFAALNCRRDSGDARALPVAAEACFSAEEHCAAVERRVARLRAITVESPIDRAAQDFIGGELVTTWGEVKAAVLSHATETAGWGERCVSPSDFGFHNCLRRADGTLVFFDFEYAGWDDPAKMVGDFFCQPALPAPADGFEAFVRATAEVLALADPERFLLRCRLLLPLYRVKWCGIMLNEFVRGERGRRAFALGADVVQERKAAQLALARRHLAKAQESIHGTIA